jgi:hypothetical protein
MNSRVENDRICEPLSEITSAAGTSPGGELGSASASLATDPGRNRRLAQPSAARSIPALRRR